MPPKRSIRRPTSVRAAKAKAKPAPKNRQDGRAKRNQKKSPKCEGDILPPQQSPRGRVYYCHELGKAHGKLVEIHQDAEGRWLGDSPQRHHFAKPPPMEAVQSQQHEHFLHLLHLSDSGAKTYLGQCRLPDASSEGRRPIRRVRGRTARKRFSLLHKHPPKPKPSSRQPKSSGFGQEQTQEHSGAEAHVRCQSLDPSLKLRRSAQVKAMIAQSHWTLECQRNSSGSPLQAPCESFLQGQENIQQLQHFRGVIPELFSFHRPQAEEDFQKTSRLSLPASLQRSSDSSSPSCCRREPRVIRSLSPLLQADPPIECRYEKASKRLLSHLSGQCQALGTTKERVDGQAQEFIEFLWEEGEGQSLAADVLSAIQHYQPSMRRCLNGSWRLFKTWQRFEIPARAPL